MKDEVEEEGGGIEHRRIKMATFQEMGHRASLRGLAEDLLAAVWEPKEGRDEKKGTQ